MAAADTALPVWTLPPADDGAENGGTFHAALSEPGKVDVESAGRWFTALVRRRRLDLPFSQVEDNNDGALSDDDDDDADSNEGEDGDGMVKISGEWKDQDHYALLGIGDLRWRATQSDIRKAHRKMVLKHHPDKKGDMTPAESEEADAYFARITKAYELLSDPRQRRLYDSVDDVDDSVPNPVKDESKFFSVFSSAFTRNARWLSEKNVPELGDENTPFEEVEEFYRVWYNAKSWREFGYDDEEAEELEQAQSRDERRWIEKSMRASRKKRKKAENARMLRLIDNAYSCDPRVKKHNEELRRKKKEAKRAKAVARQAEEEALKQKEAEAEAERLAEEERKKLDSKKNTDLLRKVRRTFTKTCRKAGIYNTENPASREQTEGTMELCLGDMDLLKAQSYEFLQKLLDLKDDQDDFIDAVSCAVADLRAAKEKKEASAREWSEEEQRLLEAAIKAVPPTDPERWKRVAKMVPNRTKRDCIARIKEIQAELKAKKEELAAAKGKPDTWTSEEELVLNKAASKVYPPGTQGDRWTKIAEYVQQHAHTEWIRSSKEVIKKVNDLKNVGVALNKVKESKDDFQAFEEGKKRNRVNSEEMNNPTTAEQREL